MLGTNGGLIGGTRTASALGSGVGLWTPNEQAALRRNRSWPLSGDRFYSYNSLLLSMDGANNSTTFTDSSPYGLTVTANGDAKISTAQSKFGGASAVFDGTGDGLSLASNAAFGFGTGDFTIEMWLYQSVSPTSGSSTLIDNRSAFGASPFSFYLKYTASGTFLGLYTSVGATGCEWDAASQRLAINTWNHIVLVRRSGSFSAFINGTKCTTVSFGNETAISGDFGAAKPLRIGIAADGSASPLNGYIDDLRITKGVARYTSNFTPPTQAHLTYGGYNDPYFPATSLLLHMDGSNGSTTFTDSSVNALAVTANGNAQISTAQSKFGGASAVFDGTGDYLTATSPNLSGSWTVEFWVYPTTASQQTIVSFNNGSFAGINIFMNASRQLVVDDGQSAQTAFTGGTLTLNSWNHVAVTRSSTTTTGWINGTSVGTNSFTPQTTSTISVGRYNGTSPNFYYFVGYLDDLRVTNGVARYTANFTPPTAPFPDL